MIQVWRNETELSALQEVAETARTFVKNVAPPLTYLMIIEESSSAPKGEAIRYLADLSREVVSQMACAVAVAEGDTYRSALLRAGVTALAALAPHRVPYQLFSRVDLALRALAPHLSDGATPAALANAISELRGQFALVAPRN